MTMNIADFIAASKRSGFQAANKFNVNISVPPALSTLLGGSPDTKFLSLMAADVGIPGVNVNSTEMHVGTTRKVAYDKSTGEFNITFRCTGDMMERKLFDAWIKYIFRKDHSVAFYDDYVSPCIEVMTIRKDDSMSYKVEITEAYPSVLTDLTLDNESTNAVLTFQVTFNYRKVITGPEDESSAIVPQYVNSAADASFGEPNSPYNFEDPDYVMGSSVAGDSLFRNLEGITREIENGGLSASEARRLAADASVSLNRNFTKSAEVLEKANKYLGKISSFFG